MDIFTNGMTCMRGTDDDEVRISLEELQDFVGGHIEYVCFPSDTLSSGRQLVMIINEEGKLMGLEPNRIATFAAQMFAGLVNDYIAGDALLAATTPEGETLALTRPEEQEFTHKLQQMLGLAADRYTG